MGTLDRVKGWLGQVVELGLLLIAFGIVAQILIGNQLPFVGNVVGNLITLIQALGDNGLVGLIALAIILYLFSKRTVA
jgi:hypothetical protein